MGAAPSSDATGSERANQLRRAATLAGRQANKIGAGSVALFGAANEALAEAAVIGLAMGSWDFRETKSPVPEADQRAMLTSITIISRDVPAGSKARIEKGVRQGQALAEGYALARRLGMLPGNICT